MIQRIAYVKTGWSDNYTGGPVVGRHTHISEFKEAHERFNFLKASNKHFYAYLPPIGKNHRPPQPQELNKWLIIFVSAKNGNGPLTVVGWYEQAVFEREYEERPEYKLNQGFETDVDGNNYIYCLSSSKAYLIPFENRDITVSGDHFKRTPIIYVRGNGNNDSWRSKLALKAEKIIKNSKLKPTIKTNPTITFPNKKHRDAVEKASIEKAIQYLKSKKYKIIDRQKDNCGYDLLAQRNEKPSELHIEVKGTSMKHESFFISRNEKEYMSHPKWRMLIVTSSLDKPKVSLLTKREVETKFQFNALSWKAELK